jgi:hypothetical protein
LRVDASSVGPLTAEIPANLVGLREALPGFTVKPVNDGIFEELHFAVYRGGELQFYVIRAEDGSIFNVHIMSPAAVIEDKPWRVGSTVANLSYLTYCECWGGKPVCYRWGEHIAIAFDMGCDASALATPAGRKVLHSERIHRAVWSPRPFDEGPSPNDSADPCGGDGADPCAGP